MAVSSEGDILSIPIYTENSEHDKVEISWSQQLRNRSARYYVVKAQNQSKGNADVLMYIEEQFYKDSNTYVYVGNLPGARQEGNAWVVTIDDHFQYGEKNKSGESRWIVLHNRDYKIFQHRFLVTTIQSKLSEAIKNLARSFGASELADQIMSSGASFIGQPLRTF
ncbi:hypothetical protein FHETE_9081 [Fusarium heterosporum]|uniref:Uncharacterized protein n=1 Tax=Fusarium heterosporum TaxID=42747 RepID=A0A8H5WIU7_FUSHE|nr:hypothetical protein FHETE_9081 [Fusarium heterosporum]